MPYVNCPNCRVRSFALAPWSTVDRCPHCEAPLPVPRQSVTGDRAPRAYWRHAGSEERPAGSRTAGSSR